MSARTSFHRGTAPLLLACLGLAAAPGCSSPAESDASAGGSSSAAGRTNGGSASAGASGSSAGAAVTAGQTSGGTAAGSSGSSGAGGGNGGSGAAGSGGTTTAGAGGGSSGGAGGGSGGSGGGGGGGGEAGVFALTSPGWTSQAGCAPDNKSGCGIFPKESIGTGLGGSNKSPELAWGAGPSGTQSYAIVLHDLTNSMGGKPFVHWVMWNIPATTRMLPAGLETTAMPSVPAGSSQRSFSGNGYQGSGKCGNVYEFVLYALTTPTFTPSGTTQTAVADGLDATDAPTASLRARSGAPGCTE